MLRSLLTSALLTFLASALRQDQGQLDRHLLEDPKPVAPPYATYVYGKENYSLWSKATLEMRDLIHGCFDEDDKKFQECIESKCQEKWGRQFWSFVEDSNSGNSYEMAGDCKAKFFYGDYGKRQYYIYVYSSCP